MIIVVIFVILLKILIEMELNESFWSFIEQNIDSNVSKIRLKYYSCKDLNFDIDFAITQIDSRQKSKKKLPGFIAYKEFLFPTTLSSEQSTSEILANFHSEIIGKGDSMLDMTCGLGIDVIFASRKYKTVTAIDINPIVTQCLKHNLKLLSIDNVNVINKDSIDYLTNSEVKYDSIFIDPARRSVTNKRTFAFDDCEPNIMQHLDLIKSHCNTLYIKASPMLDISMLIESNLNISDIWILSIKNECKEVFIKCDMTSDVKNIVKVHAVDFIAYDTKIVFEYEWGCEDKCCLDFISQADDMCNKWLYEPNSSLMKCACWRELLMKYPNLVKLHPNTHLFVSEVFYDQFPGRVKRILGVYSNKSKELSLLKGQYINIVCRNYGESVANVKKRYKTNDGGNRFLYCCRYSNNKSAILLVE